MHALRSRPADPAAWLGLASHVLAGIAMTCDEKGRGMELQ
jgi:hypothetical protein